MEDSQPAVPVGSRALNSALRAALRRAPLVQRLSESLQTRKAVAIVAPSGYGKSWLLQDLAAAVPIALVRIRPRTTFRRFANELALSLARPAPGLEQTIAAAYDRCLQAPDPPAALARWFASNVDAVRCTVAIDALDASADRQIVGFVKEAVQRSPATCKWAIVGRNLDELPMASWLAHDIAALPLDDRHLRLSASEAGSIAAALGIEREPYFLERALTVTNGAVGDFVFAARAAAELPPGCESAEALLGNLVSQAYANLSDSERTIVCETILLPRLDENAVVSLLGADLARVAARLRARMPQIFEVDKLNYQARFAQMIHSQLSLQERLRPITIRTAGTLETQGDITEALDMLASVDACEPMLAIIEKHGFACMESAHGHVLRDALDHLNAKEVGKGAAFLALMAMASAARLRGDVSESYFQNALKEAQTPQQRAQVRLYYGAELLRRGRPDALDVLNVDEGDGVAVQTRINTRSALAIAQANRANLEVAQATIGVALREAAGLPDDMTEARVSHQASWIALECGDFVKAKSLASRSLEIAERIAAYEVAAGALSVLYNVAADGDEDLDAAARCLRKMATCAARCGSVQVQLYALVCAYEIEAERGNAGAMVAIESSLSDFDIQYSAWLANETLLPAQVLKRSWSGDFEHGLRLLGSTTDQQMDDQRRALRYSEVAIYAAAAGDPDASWSALSAMRRTLRAVPHAGIPAMRTRLNCALTLVLLSRAVTGRRIAATVAEQLSPKSRRLRAFAAAIVSLADWRLHGGDYRPLLTALRELEVSGFGGIARWIGALPPHCIDRIPERYLPRRSA